VSPKAQSTICPGCYAPIELIDVNITAHASRSIDTRGHLKITAKGSVSNPWIICGSARIEGPFHGHLRCEGEARLSMQKTCTGRITAGSLVIDRKAVIDCSQLVDADSISIEGVFRGSIQCRGIVKVLKGGRLEGPVEAPSLVVEKGGIYVGDCRIAPLVTPGASAEVPAEKQMSPLEEDL
jgi:cytoskeletal protein CcmA (bactofilin family)